MSLSTLLTTQTKVTTQMVLANRLLRLSATGVEEAIERELVENPALDRIEPFLDRATMPGWPASPPGDHTPEDAWRHRGTDMAWEDHSDNSLEYLACRRSPIEQLVDQARLIVPSEDFETVVYLIGSLNGHGFLQIPEAQLADELGVSQESVRRALAWIHQLDPPGVGARDVAECFLLQIGDLETQGVECMAVRRVLETAWNAFARQRWDDVSQCTGLSRREIDAVLAFIRRNLCPYPLLLMPDVVADNATLGRPDLIFRRNDETDGPRVLVEVPSAGTYDLKINSSFQIASHAEGQDALRPEERAWICEAIARARLFITSLTQRWETLQRIGEILAEQQVDYFELGPRYHKPLTRAAVAASLGVHESTVSRAVSDKVVQLPNGRLLPMDELFDSSLSVKERIREVIASTGGCLSDREIAARLDSDSCHLARRTISKYRKELGIPAMGHQSHASLR